MQRPTNITFWCLWNVLRMTKKNVQSRRSFQNVNPHLIELVESSIVFVDIVLIQPFDCVNPMPSTEWVLRGPKIRIQFFYVIWGGGDFETRSTTSWTKSSKWWNAVKGYSALTWLFSAKCFSQLEKNVEECARNVLRIHGNRFRDFNRPSDWLRWGVGDGKFACFILLKFLASSSSRLALPAFCSCRTITTFELFSIVTIVVSQSIRRK